MLLVKKCEGMGKITWRTATAEERRFHETGLCPGPQSTNGKRVGKPLLSASFWQVYHMVFLQSRCTSGERCTEPR